MSNIACWPIHHTTLIEDALASSFPLVVRETPNTSHSVEENGEFVHTGSYEELVLSLGKILISYDNYIEGAIKMHDRYSYSTLVKQF